MKVSKHDLYLRYGIELPTGKYSIKVDGNMYYIYTVKDDTEGCILVGDDNEVLFDAFLANSRKAMDRLLPLLTVAASKEVITITIGA